MSDPYAALNQSLLLDPWPGDPEYDATEAQTFARRYYWRPEDCLTEELGLTLCDHDGEPGILSAVQAILTILLQREAASYGWSVEHQQAIRPDIEPWRAGETPPVYVCLGGGTSVGKTEVALAGMAVWYLRTRYNGRVIFTGAKDAQKQIRDSVWTRFRRHWSAVSASHGELGRMYELRTMEWKHTDEHRAFYLTASGKESTQGLHALDQFIIVDEAEGAPAEFLDNLATAVEQTGRRSVVVLAANPETEESAFHRLFHTRASISFTLDASKHPNITGRPVRVWRDGSAVTESVDVHGAISRAYVAGRVDAGWLEPAEGPDARRHHILLEWLGGWFAPRQPEWFSKVKGIVPPFGGSGTVATAQLLEDAQQRGSPVAFDPSWATLGIDLCGEGDDEGSGWCNWGGGHLWNFWRDATGDEDRAYESVAAQCLELRGQGVKSVEVRYDAGGSLGRTLRNRLKADVRLDGWVHVIPLHFYSAPEDATAYHRAVDEAYWTLAAILENAVLHSCPPRMKSGLTGRRVRYPQPIVKGVQVQALEPKKDFIERAKFSPDDADAAALAAPFPGWKRRRLTVGKIA